MCLSLDLRLLARRTLPLLAMALLLIVPALGKSQALAAEPLDMKGVVGSRPTGTRLGDWTIDGQNFSVTAQTTFLGFGDLGPQVGTCVEVRYNQATPQTRIVVGMLPDNNCGAPGQPEPTEWKGTIASRPEGGADGVWVIGGKSFSITPATFFEGFGGVRPVALTCVEVTFAVNGAVNVALNIRPSETCNGAADLHSFRGPIDQRPVTKVGDWVIGGQVFSVTAATAFATVYATSQPQAGDCVGLRYTQSAGVRQVVTIFPASCTEAPPTEGLFEAAGPVDAWPGSATFGAWTIGGVAYDARDAVVGPPAFPAATFQQEFGNLGIGVCALVHYRLDGTTRVAVRIESKPDFRCTRSAEEHEFYGLIKTLSTTTGQLGLWEIGALKVMVTQDTRLSGAPFFIGQLVEVKFQRAGDGTLLATSIEGKGRSGNEEHQRGRGKAFGVIGTLPANGVIGSWSIGGTTYNVTDGTRIADGYTPAVNDCVEVYFQVIANVRTAAKIQLAAGDCTGNAEEIGRAYGTVTSMPESGYVGNWTVAGVDYTATGATEFEAEHGPLAMGAFVELRYVRVGDGRVARSIRTLVPPGAGDNVRAGRLETSGVNSLSGASTAGISTTTWKVSGVTYQVNSDTLLDDTLAALQTGANVQVNAFVDPLTGTLVATQVAASTSTFLPMVER